MSRSVFSRLRRALQTVVPISAAAYTLSTHRNGGNVLNRLTVATVQAGTLPAANGKRGSFRVEVGVTATGNKTLKCAGTDVFEGTAVVTATTSGSFGTASNTNTITLNGTTTGGIAGSIVEFQDVAVGKWAVKVAANGSGTAATPFSNT